MSDYRLQYLDRSRKFIRQDVVNAATDDEAIAMVSEWRLPRRSELWKEGQLIATLSRHSTAISDRRD